MLYYEFWVGDLNGTFEKNSSSKKNPSVREHV